MTWPERYSRKRYWFALVVVVSPLLSYAQGLPSPAKREAVRVAGSDSTISVVRDLLNRKGTVTYFVLTRPAGRGSVWVLGDEIGNCPLLRPYYAIGSKRQHAKVALVEGDNDDLWHISVANP